MGEDHNPLLESGASEEPDSGDETSGILSPAFANLSDNRKIAILVAAALITAIEISNRISLNVILPDLQGNVAGDVDQASWVLILYNMGFIVSMILTPWMSRVFGARRHFTICVALYTVGAIGCFLSAHNLTTLLASRAIMGLGGGFFLLRMFIMAGLFFTGKARMIPFTWVYLVLYSMQVFYPTAMGAISDTFHWNYVFLLDLPFLFVGTLVLRKLMPAGHVRVESARREKGDLWGASFIICALVALQICSSRGERDLWFESPFISSCFVVSLAAFILFVWWESRPDNPSPVLHLRHIYHLPSLRNALLSAMIVGALLGGGLYVIPQYLRLVQGYSATQTGEFFSCFGVGFGTGAFLTLRVLIRRIGVPFSVFLGMSLFAATFIGFVYSWTPSPPTFLMAAMLFCQGTSQGLVVVGVGNAVTGQLTAADLWEGDTAFFFIRQLGNTFGLTAVTVLFDRRMTLHSSRLIDVANRLDPTTQSSLSNYASLIARSGGATSNPQLGALQLFQSNVITQSSLLSYVDISAFLAVLCVLGALSAALLRPSGDVQHWSFSSIHH